jgi:predicted ArsR family transcriptional regulator
MTRTMIAVSQRLVTPYEFELLHELAAGEGTAYCIGEAVGPDGFTALRTLSSLEARGLVARYWHQDRTPVLAWRLTAAGAQPFR